MLQGETAVFCPGDALERVAIGAHYVAEGSDDHQHHLHEQHHHCYHVEDHHHHHKHVHDQHAYHHRQGLVWHQRAISSLDEFLEAGSSRTISEDECLSLSGALLHSPTIIMAKPCRLTVGYALTAKKVESFLKPGLVAHARSKGIFFSVIDSERPLLEQGHFDVILHKIMGKVWHQQLKAYKQLNPKVFIFDPPEAIMKVCNRKSMLQVVADLNFHHSQGAVGVPRQLVVDDDTALISEVVARENMNFPLVVKPLWIDGTAKSHALSLAFNEAGLSRLTTPLVLQEFVNHGGFMFKVYVVGHVVKVVHRPSLPDICGDEYRGAGVMPFPRVSSATASVAGIDLETGVAEYPPEEMLSLLAKQVSSRLGLSLFNLDMIRENGKGNQYYVIDINYFPGYGKVPDYEEAFIDFLLSLANENECK